MPAKRDADFVSEEVSVVRSGMKKADLATVMMQINNHYFKFSSIEQFEQFVVAMGINCAQFKEISSVKNNVELRVLN